MITRHAELAGALASELALPDAVVEAVGASYERWDGRGLAGRAARRRDPARRPDRPHRRVRRGRPPGRRRRRGAGPRPAPRRRPVRSRPDDGAVRRRREGLPRARRAERVGRRDRRRARALARPRRGRVRGGAGGGRPLRRPQVPLHPRALDGGRRAGGASDGAPRPAGRGGAGRAPRRTGHGVRATGRVQRHLGQGRAAERRRVGAGPAPPAPHRAHAPPVPWSGPARPHRGAAPRAPGRVRLPEGAHGSGDPAPGPRARRGRRVPGHAGAETTPAGARRGRGGPDAARRGPGRTARRRRRRRRAGGGRPPGGPAPRGAGRAHRPGGRGAVPARPRPVEQGDRRPAGDHAQDGRQPRRAHLRQARRVEPGGRRALRRAARVAARGAARASASVPASNPGRARSTPAR